MSHRTSSRRVLAAAGLACLFAGSAFAHAFLKSATPGVGSRVSTAPSAVEITFTEGVEPAFSSITVTNAEGARVDDGAVHRAGSEDRLAVGLKSLRPGTYTVTWHATATDTHKTTGQYRFTVTR